MNKPIVFVIIILLIIGAIAVNEILSEPEVNNSKITPENTGVVSNPVQNNSNNTSYNGPEITKPYVSQR